MKKIIFLIAIIFGFTFLIADSDAWNQPQIDKAQTFQKLFNGETKSDAAVSRSGSGASTAIYIAFGAIVVVFTVTLGFIIRARKNKAAEKEADDEE